ncbi:MAG TPA: M1 family aminopeptidase [Acidisarcina sp.]
MDTSVPEEANPEDPAIRQEADEERSAATLTAYNLDVRVFASQGSIAVRASLTVRNDGATPLKRLRLQLSSTLAWERVLTGGRPAAFNVQALRSDVDHTGRVTEAVITLPSVLAPRSTLIVDAMYSGAVPLNAMRLEQIGTPTDIALHSDWDQVSSEAVALRGFGDVLWYPASAPPVALGDGAKYFSETGRHKLAQIGASFKASITEEFAGEPPDLAVLNGRVEPVNVVTSPSGAYPGVVTVNSARSTLGFIEPSLFLLRRREIDGEDLQVYTSSTDGAGAQNYLAAAALADALVHQWLGGRPPFPLTVVDLPEPDDASFESGSTFFTSIASGSGLASASPPTGEPDNKKPDTRKLAQTLTHALSHASFQSLRPWLDEGVAHFLSNEWLVQTGGRQTALEAGELQRNALALAEPGTPGESKGESLVSAFDPIYYRTKAAYVLGMLRDIAGESALSTALRAYVSADDKRDDYFESLVEKASGKDLRWFFDSWVYRDQGLPDLSIVRIYPRQSSEAGQYLVTLDLANDGYAEVEVPVTVRSSETSVTERVRIAGRGQVTHRILLPGEPLEVELNDGSVPEVQATLHRHTILASTTPEAK